MPQLSPMSWVMVFLFFLICWVSIMVIFWWSASGEYKVTSDKSVKKVGGGIGSSIGWGFNKYLKSS
uniref:ATP synthase F0 subunit 8 n=1 Tax=Solenaia carinata TaxID=1903492 RepID=V9NEW7_9BIVA|nr:ATP synthase F0 subunit 8 [Solenaia carinata]AGO02019.1 ATP synthase F0 subunit 8 [Solenaia carinata]